MRDEYPHGCCPVLRFYAEAEALLAAGVVRASPGAPEAIVIGRLRQRYGCPGPRYGMELVCPWMQRWGSEMAPDMAVPRVGRQRDDGRRTPGAML